MTCPDGHALPDGARFCDTCGCPVGGAPVAPPSPAGPVVLTPAVVVPAAGQASRVPPASRPAAWKLAAVVCVAAATAVAATWPLLHGDATASTATSPATSSRDGRADELERAASLLEERGFPGTRVELLPVEGTQRLTSTMPFRDRDLPEDLVEGLIEPALEVLWHETSVEADFYCSAAPRMATYCQTAEQLARTYGERS